MILKKMRRFLKDFCKPRWLRHENVLVCWCWWCWGVFFKDFSKP